MVCQLTPAQEARMYEILRGIADDPHALEMQQFIQHGRYFQQIGSKLFCARIVDRAAQPARHRLHLRALPAGDPHRLLAQPALALPCR